MGFNNNNNKSDELLILGDTRFEFKVTIVSVVRCSVHFSLSLLSFLILYYPKFILNPQHIDIHTHECSGECHPLKLLILTLF